MKKNLLSILFTHKLTISKREEIYQTNILAMLGAKLQETFLFAQMGDKS